MSWEIQTAMICTAAATAGLEVKEEVPLGPGLFHGIRADLVLYGLADYLDGLAVECKWQESPGSADHKIAYTCLSIQRHYPIPAVIVCGGARMAPALAWLKGEVDGVQLVGAFSMEEYTAWLRRMTRG